MERNRPHVSGFVRLASPASPGEQECGLGLV